MEESRRNVYFHHSFVVVVVVVLFVLPWRGQGEEEFVEDLLLRPLPDGSVLAHFHFASSLPPVASSRTRHHRLFPKAISQLVQKFRIQEMELSFTQGRWNYEKWGGMDPVASANAKPSGVELWAMFGDSEGGIDATWGNLTHALSGLFCASINFLASSAMTANPASAFQPQGSRVEEQQMRVLGSDNFPDPVLKETTRAGQLRYGALPGEAVCTENLTPWLKLLPCRDKAGLGALLYRPTIYRVQYHSLRLHVRSSEFHTQVQSTIEGTILHQVLTLVMQPSSSSSLPRMQPDWSLASLFGRDVADVCPLAKSSTVYIELERNLVSKLRGLHKEGSTTKDDADADICIGRKQSDPQEVLNIHGNDKYSLHVIPDRVLCETDELEQEGACKGFSSVLLEYSLAKSLGSGGLSIGIVWKSPLFWVPLQGPFRSSRFITGSGNARGKIAISLKPNQLADSVKVSCGQSVGICNNQNGVDVVVFQIMPWYVQLYYHTLQVIVDQKTRPLKDVVKWMHLSPAEDRKAPGVLELMLNIPCNTTSAALVIEFDKGFLRIDEHPPDANRGFDLPSALIIFPNMHTMRHYRRLSTDAVHSPLLDEFEENKVVQLYTEVLLMPLATPDFSMPYNVITLTCTILALYFGSLLNVLRRRIGEEDRISAAASQGKGLQKLGKLKQFIRGIFGGIGTNGSSFSKYSRLVKILVIVVALIVMNYYIT